jgi:hypothetical protein
MSISTWFKQRCQKEPTPNMNLEQFLSETLIQICRGVRTAQEKITATPYNPENEKYHRSYIVPSPRGGREKEIYDVKFDVAVTVSNTISSMDKTSIQSDILVISANISLGDEKTVSKSTASISRIQFSIPIIYPSMPVPHPGDEK